MNRLTIIIFLLFFSVSVSAELNLKPVNPNESVDYTFNKRLSFENSLNRIKQIESALDSFRKLTDVSKDKISIEEFNTIGNTEWESQNLGFPNWTKAIEGTLYSV